MFTQAVGMTTSDWPVSRVVRRSQTIDLNLASLLSLNFKSCSAPVISISQTSNLGEI